MWVHKLYSYLFQAYLFLLVCKNELRPAITLPSGPSLEIIAAIRKDETLR